MFLITLLFYITLISCYQCVGNIVRVYLSSYSHFCSIVILSFNVVYFECFSIQDVMFVDAFCIICRPTDLLFCYRFGAWQIVYFTHDCNTVVIS